MRVQFNLIFARLVIKHTVSKNITAFQENTVIDNTYDDTKNFHYW